MPKKVGISKSASKDPDEEDGTRLQSRAQRKREEKAESQAELAVKKAEARLLAEQEEMELVKARKQKLTEAERLRRQEEAVEAQRRLDEKRKKEIGRWVDEREYARVVCTANTNRAGLDVDARNVEEAIAQLTLPQERHPEKRIMASFKAFEEMQLERLKQEKAGLTRAQYKDAIKKLWKKSADKPP